ncbi:MAG: J domain-containing protein, partial [Deltaproteobacteria bacterium]|nr:J domain-containing protein [Deltaproteobacteria bacterium]
GMGGNLNDIFGELFQMGGMRRGHKGRQRAAHAEPVHGRDITTDVTIDFLEAIHGASRQVRLHREGGGETLTVKIPPGVENGSKVRIAGKGEQGQHGGLSGDLYLQVHVNPHPLFWREDSNIFCNVPITIYEAVLGANVDVPTLDGTAKMKIPAATSSGQKFRLKGKGAPILGKKGTTGDQYVIVQIVPPKKIDSETEEWMREWAQKHPYNPRES